MFARLKDREVLSRVASRVVKVIANGLTISRSSSVDSSFGLDRSCRTSVNIGPPAADLIEK